MDRGGQTQRERERDRKRKERENERGERVEREKERGWRQGGERMESKGRFRCHLHGYESPVISQLGHEGVDDVGVEAREGHVQPHSDHPPVQRGYVVQGGVNVRDRGGVMDGLSMR